MLRWHSPFALLALTLPLSAGVIHVPADQPSIGQAIQAARDGDLILVDDGTYTGTDNRDMRFDGKTLTVRSMNGPQGCVIDCEFQGRAFIFDSGESQAALVEGFTITRGDAPAGNGGAIDCTLESSPTLRDCVFTNNHAYALGGAVACRGMSLAVIEGCVFIGNNASGYPDGAYGGALSCFVLSDATVTDCEFWYNHADFGGAIDCSVSFPRITDCLMVGNSALRGGAIECGASDPVITRCTITQNSASAGGGLALLGLILPSYPVLDSCILWNNAPDEVAAFIGAPSIAWSDVQGGWPGTGNIALDPRFVDPAGGDFHLTGTSPCIDAGNPAAAMDPDCTPADMGAFPHLQSAGPAVYCSAKPTSSGCTPALAFTGTPSATAAGTFSVSATQIEADSLGLFFWGTSGPASVPFQGGVLCVQPPLVRTPAADSGASGHAPCPGVLTLDLNATGVCSAIGSGGRGWLQGWFREPQSPSGSGLTDAVAFSVCP